MVVAGLGDGYAVKPEWLSALVKTFGPVVFETVGKGGGREGRGPPRAEAHRPPLFTVGRARELDPASSRRPRICGQGALRGTPWGGDSLSLSRNRAPDR